MKSNSPSASGPSVASHLASTAVSATSYRVLVSVEEGLHRGAAYIAPSSQSVYLGSSPDCDLVLMDDGVPDKAMRLYERDGLLIADVRKSAACVSGVALPLGEHVFDEPVARLQVGGAVLRVELLRRKQQDVGWAPDPRQASVEPAVAPQRRSWAAFTLAGLIVATALAVVGGAVNASARRGSQQETRTLSSIVDSYNSLGAQMTVSGEAEQTPRLSGLIPDPFMKQRLESDIRAAGLRVEIQLHDIRQMGESLTRLALLGGHPCEARHLGAGRFECDAGTADRAAVSQLRELAQQVPGVVGLNVQSREPASAPAPAPAPPPVQQSAAPVVPVAAPAPPKLPVIRAVAVGEQDSVAYDSHGRRLRVGDTVDGAKVKRIQFEGVEFVRDKQRYTVGITAVLTSASGGAVK